MGFTQAELQRHAGEVVADLIGDDPRLVFVGINPGLWTAAAEAHFAHPGNRFYPALYLAGITDREIDASGGYSPADVAHLEERGIAITNIVDRATARADELGREELERGADALRAKLAAWRPAVVAIVGITAYRTAFGRRGATAGEQEEDLAGARLWVLGNPSGLNAHETTGSLARAYRQPAEAAGIPLDPPRWR
ncbi:MAG: mismatch-specific DNA-glycosylase [Nitriliruptorales bacterium]|nr:mismatch-specific DNA-glycosylase [Nitriliruptorales bacterium]